MKRVSFLAFSLLLSACVVVIEEPVQPTPSSIPSTASPTASETPFHPIELPIRAGSLPTQAPNDLEPSIEEERAVLTEAGRRELELISTDTSPDGQWSTTWFGSEVWFGEGPFVHDTYRYQRLTLSSQGTHKHYMLYEGVTYAGIGGGAPYVVQWPNTSNELLLATGGLGDGCFVFGYAKNLTRVSLSSQIRTKILENLGEFALSPTEDHLVFSTDWNIASASELSVTLWSLTDSSNQTWLFPIEAERIGNFVWAPDGNAIAFTAVKDICGQNEQSAIFHFDLRSQKLTMLTNFNEMHLTTFAWKANKIEVGGIHSGSPAYLLDTTNGTLLPLED